MSDADAFFVEAVRAALAVRDAAVTPPPVPPPVPQPLPGGLPGQVTWKNGANNLQFGSNDTFQWPTVTAPTSPKIRQLLADAKLGIIREWFPKTRYGAAGGPATTDAELEARIQVAVQAGAVCLGVLSSWQDLEWCKHVVSYLGDRCLLYEYGNEPDPKAGTWQGNVAAYANAWKAAIPVLRTVNPNAKFVGPVSPAPEELDVFLPPMKNTGVVPDAVSFHYYGTAAALTAAINKARVTTTRLYGASMPLGLTEWNISGVYPLPSMVTDDKAMHDYVVAAQRVIVASGLSFAVHFDIANQVVNPSLDMFDVVGATSESQVQVKGSYYGLKDAVVEFRP